MGTITEAKPKARTAAAIAALLVLCTALCCAAVGTTLAYYTAQDSIVNGLTVSVPEPEPVAFAVYSDDDKSLDFYKRPQAPSAGDVFEGKVATAVFEGIENTGYNTPWRTYAANVTNAAVVDGGIRPTKTYHWFAYFDNITSVIGLDRLDTSNVTDMGAMFYGCSGLTTLDVSNWDTGNVTDMFDMFYYCKGLTTLDASNWDTSNVTDMRAMFYACSSLTTLDVSNWDTGNVTDMGHMFDYCSSLTTLDVSNWDTSNVTNMSGMFRNCTKIAVDCSAWNVSKVTMRSDFATNVWDRVIQPAWAS